VKVEYLVPPVLILAYRRLDSLINIIEGLKKIGCREIYISCDGPDRSNQFDANFLKVQGYLNSLKSTNEIEYRIRIQSEHFGCAVNVLSSVDWFFSNVSFGVVLEDDCIPSEQFFKFIDHSKNVFMENREIWFICGTQAVPSFYFSDSWVLSDYPQLWGWATSSERWKEMKLQLLNHRFLSEKDSTIDYFERVYWNAGSRRALEGFTDVWDTVIVQLMRGNGKLALLPNKNLVINIGDDTFATNVNGVKLHLYSKTYSFNFPVSPPVQNSLADSWFYAEILKGHKGRLITIKINIFLDYFRKKKFNKGLIERLLETNFFHNAFR
jgi:hypothetical protein